MRTHRIDNYRRQTTHVLAGGKDTQEGNTGPLRFQSAGFPQVRRCSPNHKAWNTWSSATKPKQVNPTKSC